MKPKNATPHRLSRNYHILNGDCLREQFPKQLTGAIIIARECLVDGEVKQDNLDDFFQERAKFLTSLHGDYSVEEYFNKSAAEFKKIIAIPSQSKITLWFEDDLFCQVNFWFVAYLLFHFVQEGKVFLARPPVHTQYGFGGLNESALLKVFEERVEITELEKIASLWTAYQNNDTAKLISIARALKESLPFILNAVEAHIARIPTKDNPGRPVQSLIEIMHELETEAFAPVFREFNKRESIYGFGDLQVKRLFDEIKNNRNGYQA